MVICKSCGFIIEKGKLGDRCPACGVPAKMFLPHDEHISQKRKMLLSLDIHPVMVHFPQAFITTILLLSLASAALHGWVLPLVGATVKILCLLLPFTIAISFAAGLFDGKLRFRKVRTPLLIRKMVIGTVFFIIGCALFACAAGAPADAPLRFLLIAALAIPGLACAAILGKIGTSLINARFPG